MNTINKDGIELIKRWEGCKLKAYKDTGGVLTIGYGHTKGVKPGDEIDQKEADRLLKKDLKEFEDAVNSVVKVSLSQNQFNALVSLCYNIGARAFEHSTLLKHLNSGDYSRAATQFVRWSYDNGRFIQGLKNRRVDEMNHFYKD